MSKLIIQAIIPPVGSTFKGFATAPVGSLVLLLLRLAVTMIAKPMTNQTCLHQWTPYPQVLASLEIMPILFQRNC